LRGKNIRERERELFEVVVVEVKESARQQVGIRDGELERSPRHLGRALAVLDEIEPAAP
jgi:hypothetical protein